MDASDKDSARNAEIRYSVDDEHFSINDDGMVVARQRLDADQTRQGFHIYRFNITARDSSNPPRQSTAIVTLVFFKFSAHKSSEILAMQCVCAN